MEIVRKSDPRQLEELERSFKPMEVREDDMSALECLALGLRVGVTGSFRVMVVYAVSLQDVNKMTHIAKVMGRATGLERLVIPCDGVVEWGQVQDLMERRQGLHMDREKRAIERKLAFQQTLDRFLPDEADRQMKQLAGKSTFGYGGKLQRIA